MYQCPCSLNDTIISLKACHETVKNRDKGELIIQSKKISATFLQKGDLDEIAVKRGISWKRRVVINAANRAREMGRTQ